MDPNPYEAPVQAELVEKPKLPLYEKLWRVIVLAVVIAAFSLGALVLWSIAAAD